MEITQYQLWNELQYSPSSGVFTRCSTGLRACRSDLTKGYLRVFVLGKYYKAHRLAWFYIYGVWPAGQIDHIDGNKENNSFLNLRDVSQTINMYNQSKAHKHNTSNVIGVGVSGSKFVAKIKIGSKLLHLGTFKTKEEAYEHYTKKKSEIVFGMESC